MAAKKPRTPEEAIKQRRDQLAAKAETMLLHYIEPYATFMQQYGYAYPKDILMEAWRNIMKVEAHDSIHGAGTKEIVSNSVYIINQAIDIAQAVARRGPSEEKQLASCLWITKSEYPQIRLPSAP